MPLLSPETTGIVVFSLLLVWLVLGAHIGVALGLAGFLGIYLSVGPDAAFAQIAAIPFGTTNSFSLAVIPLFILMGSFATVFLPAGTDTDAACARLQAVLGIEVVLPRAQAAGVRAARARCVAGRGRARGQGRSTAACVSCEVRRVNKRACGRFAAHQAPHPAPPPGDVAGGCRA